MAVSDVILSNIHVGHSFQQFIELWATRFWVWGEDSQKVCGRCGEWSRGEDVLWLVKEDSESEIGVEED